MCGVTGSEKGLECDPTAMKQFDAAWANVLVYPLDTCSMAKVVH